MMIQQLHSAVQFQFNVPHRDEEAFEADRWGGGETAGGHFVQLFCGDLIQFSLSMQTNVYAFPENPLELIHVYLWLQVKRKNKSVAGFNL